MRLFKDGQKVLYKRLAKVGTVVCCINEDDPADIRTQGYRYYVDVAGIHWSIPEWALSAKLPGSTKKGTSEKANEFRATDASKNPKMPGTGPKTPG